MVVGGFVAVPGGLLGKRYGIHQALGPAIRKLLGWLAWGTQTILTLCVLHQPFDLANLFNNLLSLFFVVIVTRIAQMTVYMDG